MSQPRARLETREILLIVFFAAFLVAAKAAMRWHIHVPGHAMIGTAFGLVLVRHCVDRRSAATLAGLIAGVIIAILGMGKGGPLLLLKFALPGAVVDLGTALGPRRGAPISIGTGVFLGALAGTSGVIPLVLIEWLADADPAVIALHALGSGIGKMLFGAAGGAAAAWVARELAHHGLLPTAPSEPT